MNAEKVANACIIAGVISALVGTSIFWGQWLSVLLIWVIWAPVFTFILALGSGFFLTMFGATIENPEDKEPSVWIDEKEELIVGHSEEIVGKIAGFDIYEWVMLKRPDTGELVKCFYERTVDIQQEEIEFPEDGWFVINNNTMYVAKPEKA